jgi:formylglycine-generating enzyme required for sulfatase activity
MYEVTQAQYQDVVGRNPSHFAPSGGGKDKVVGHDTSTYPVEMVNALEFCEKLTQRDQSSPAHERGDEIEKRLSATGYGLPTEAEWEFACRAGTATKYSTGDQLRQLNYAAWSLLNTRPCTRPVGELMSNAFGLCDMLGNVWEWCHDYWGPNYYGRFEKQQAIDPRGPPSSGAVWVIRGGSCVSPASHCRSSHRARTGYAGYYLGFRVSLSVGFVRQRTSASDFIDQPQPVKWAWPADAPAPAIAPFGAEQALAHQEAWAEHLGVPVEYTNSIGMKFRLIPPGEFLMGSPAAEIEELEAIESAFLKKENWSGWIWSQGPECMKSRKCNSRRSSVETPRISPPRARERRLSPVSIPRRTPWKWSPGTTPSSSAGNSPNGSSRRAP